VPPPSPMLALRRRRRGLVAWHDRHHSTGRAWKKQKASCTAPSALSGGTIEVCSLTTHGSQAESAPVHVASGSGTSSRESKCRSCFLRLSRLLSWRRRRRLLPQSSGSGPATKFASSVALPVSARMPAWRIVPKDASSCARGRSSGVATGRPDRLRPEADTAGARPTTQL